MKNYFIIYARDIQYNSGYKIISGDNSVGYSIKKTKKIDELEIGKTYILDLIWVTKPSPENKVADYLEFKRCITRYPFVEICTEAGFELYESSDLQGVDVLTRN